MAAAATTARSRGSASAQLGAIEKFESASVLRKRAPIVTARIGYPAASVICQSCADTQVLPTRASRKVGQAPGVPTVPMGDRKEAITSVPMWSGFTPKAERPPQVSHVKKELTGSTSQMPASRTPADRIIQP